MMNLETLNIPDYVSERVINGKLCLINQKKDEAWLYNSSSIAIWNHLKNHRNVSEKLSEDAFQRFVTSLYDRELVELDFPLVLSENGKKNGKLVAHNRTLKLGYEAYKSHTIYNAMIELIYNCNLKCVHCYLSSIPKNILTFNEIKDLLDQLADHGCPGLFFTGGEIFIRNDIIEIVKYAQKRGFLMSLFTNGTLITRQHVKELAQIHLSVMKISLYGTSAKTHEKITQVKGSFQKTLDNIKLLREYDIPVDIGILAFSHNTNEVMKIDSFCEKLGVRYNIDIKLFPKQDNSKEPLKYTASDADLKRLFEECRVSPMQETICLAGQVKLKINPLGLVYPCEYWREPIGSIREQRLVDIWNSSKLDKIVKSIRNYDPSGCDSCELKSSCFKCPAFVDMNSDAIPSQFCRWTRLYSEVEMKKSPL